MNEKSQPDAAKTPIADESARAKQAERGPEWGYYVVPAVCWLYFSYIALTLLPPPLSLWFAVPCAFLIGFIATALFTAFLIACGGHTLLEMEVNMAICLVLLLILAPVFTRARDKARHQEAIAHQRALQAMSASQIPHSSSHP